MKKFTIFTIAFALVCALSSFVFASNVQTKVDETITVSFALSAEEAIAAGDYTISYDPAYLTYVEGSMKPVDEDCERVKNGETESTVRCIFTGKTDVKEVTAQFKVKKAGNTAVTMSKSAFTTKSGKKLTVSTEPANLTIAESIIKNEIVENDVVENDVVENDVVENDVVENDVVENDVVENDVVENEVDTPSTTNTVKNDDDDKKTYDQTGANIAIVAVIALAVVLGSAIVIKRK